MKRIPGQKPVTVARIPKSEDADANAALVCKRLESAGVRYERRPAWNGDIRVRVPRKSVSSARRALAQ